MPLPPHMKELVDRAAARDNHTEVVPWRYTVPLDKFLWLESASMDRLVTALKTETDTLRENDCTPKKSVTEKRIFSLRLLLTNLLKLHKRSHPPALAISLSPNTYSNKSRYSQPMLSYRPTKAIYNALLALGYINVVAKGYYDRNKQQGTLTRIEATEKLSSLFEKHFPDYPFFKRHCGEEVIWHRDANKDYFHYEDTDYSNAARANLIRINQKLAKHWYDLEMTNAQFEELEAKLSENHEQDETKPSVLNLNARSLYRVFNNGSATDTHLNFRDGGRFYGGWWETIPSEYRRYITIDGKKTVEVDYSTLHPSMLYNIEDKTLEGDAYDIPHVERSYVKTAFQQLLNGKGYYKVPAAFTAQYADDYSWEELLDALKEKHSDIAHHFETGIGLQLQKQDADILEQVLLRFVDKNYPALPVHDSILVHHGLEEDLKAIMQEEYQKVLGHTIRLKTENYMTAFLIEKQQNTREIKTSEDIPWDDSDIGEQLEPEEQYERRQLEWLMYKAKP